MDLELEFTNKLGKKLESVADMAGTSVETVVLVLLAIEAIKLNTRNS
jgi:hypothetical protein